MTRFTIASFNVKNLIGAGAEYDEFQSYTPEEFAWKADWLADRVVCMDADTVGFQEIFEEPPLAEVINEVPCNELASDHGQIMAHMEPYGA